MRLTIPLTALALTLAACTTPQERCISNARAEQYNIANQIRIVEGNIARGYAIHRQSVRYSYLGTCTDQTGANYPCEKTDTRIDETPVAIDIAQERRKLAPLQNRLATIQARVDARIAQCQAQYRE